MSIQIKIESGVRPRNRRHNFTTNGNIAYALILVNGLCATSAAQLANLQYQMCPDISSSSKGVPIFVRDNLRLYCVTQRTQPAKESSSSHRASIHFGPAFSDVPIWERLLKRSGLLCP
jgi:hypothetical protein